MTITLDAAALAGIGTVLTAIGTLVGVLFGRGRERDKHRLEVRRVETEDWKAVTDGLTAMLESTRGELATTREELASTNGRVDVLQTERGIDGEWITLLQAHILSGKGPPPPTRPVPPFAA